MWPVDGTAATCRSALLVDADGYLSLDQSFCCRRNLSLVAPTNDLCPIFVMSLASVVPLAGGSLILVVAVWLDYCRY
jgi:hypothetical protein